MSDLKVEGFKTGDIMAALSQAVSQFSDTERQAQIKKTNGIFEFIVKNDEGKEATWTIDMKKKGEVSKGPAKPKADVTIRLSDETFAGLTDGSINGQKAFMTGKLKAKGNIMLATKLDSVLKTAKAKL
ncbi:sterol-binding-like protein [Marasmius fiardii PR-910]|nr:sterol-binding-like protein [Marasmius fiardii PR-910]